MARPRRANNTAQLPSLYHPWVEELLGGTLPAETEAPCHDCAMLPEPGAAPSASRDILYFDPRVKCCTYVPALANFLVGNILLDTSPEMAAGRASVLRRIEIGVGVTPLGLAQPPAFAVLYEMGGAATFGQAVHLRCPHYLADTGGCGIWRHRQSVCSTWFCKYARGSVGEQFWRALRRLLSLVEASLAVHCVRTLGPGPAAAQHAAAMFTPTPPTTLRASELDGLPDPSAVALWGRHHGREVAYYEAAGRLVSAMDLAAVRRGGGVELDLAVDVLRASYAALRSTRLPRALRTGAIHVTPVSDDRAELMAYSAYHPMTVPTALLPVLSVFDGRPTSQALAAAAAAGLALDRAAVRRLVDMGVLVDADAP